MVENLKNFKPMVADISPHMSTQTLNSIKKDGLLTYMDQLKYQEYEKNTEKWLQNHIVINFDMIRARWRGSPLTTSAREYNTLREEDFKTHPEKRNRRISTVVDLWIGLSLYLHFRLAKKIKLICLFLSLFKNCNRKKMHFKMRLTYTKNFGIRTANVLP